MEYDVFISYAIEDKNSVALPLAKELEKEGIRVWIDQFELSIGDSLLNKIQQGINASKYGVVILSKSFLNKNWSTSELNTLFSKELSQEKKSEKIVLPVWHELTHKDILQNCPFLADKYAVTTTQGIHEVAEQIMRVVLHAKNDHSINKSNIKLNTQVATILFLGANPIDTNRLRIDKELRKIDDGLQSAKLRDHFKLVSKWAVKVETLSKAMLDYEPQIVHFAGHGEKKGIALEQDDGTVHIVPVEALKRLFRLFKDKVKCVVLNACYSEEQARVISEHNIYVVGMNDRIKDKTAIDFAVGFYQSIGAGKDYEFAFEMGLTHIESHEILQADIPVMWKDGKPIEFED